MSRRRWSANTARRRAWLLAGALTAAVAPAFAYGNGLPGDPVAPVILAVTAILFFALIGRFTAVRLGQPSVLGELLMGLMLGNIGHYLGVDLMTVLREGPALFTVVEGVLAGAPLEATAVETLGEPYAAAILAILKGPQGPQTAQVAHTLDVFSHYGVIFLLFVVGLQTSVADMRSLGAESARVGVVGVALPLVLGFTAARLVLEDSSLQTDLFVGATLVATSVGVTASVLQDLNREASREARIVLGAAVIDDILGLIILAIISGIVVAGGVAFTAVAGTVALATLFLVCAVAVGPRLLHLIIGLVRDLDIIEAKMIVSFLFVMVLAWLANMVGLATIIGAFTAGVILSDNVFADWGPPQTHRYTIKDVVKPLEVVLVPIFFVLMGVQVKLETFLDWSVVLPATVLLVVAIVGKLAAGWMVHRDAARWVVGVGMVPRGEVGLIFATIGKTLGVIGDAMFSSIVLMVIVTTLITPPLLKSAIARSGAAPTDT